jgi:hypothetical protein
VKGVGGEVGDEGGQGGLSIEESNYTGWCRKSVEPTEFKQDISVELERCKTEK